MRWTLDLDNSTKNSPKHNSEGSQILSRVCEFGCIHQPARHFHVWWSLSGQTLSGSQCEDCSINHLHEYPDCHTELVRPIVVQYFTIPAGWGRRGLVVFVVRTLHGRFVTRKLRADGNFSNWLLQIFYCDCVILNCGAGPIRSPQCSAAGGYFNPRVRKRFNFLYIKFIRIFSSASFDGRTWEYVSRTIRSMWRISLTVESWSWALNTL